MRQSWLYDDVLKVLTGFREKRGGLKALSLASHIRRKGATLALAQRVTQLREHVAATKRQAVVPQVFADTKVVRQVFVLAQVLADTNLTVTNVSAALSSTVLVEQLEVVVTDLLAGRGAISRSGHTDAWAAAMRAVRSRHRQVRQSWHALTCTNATCPGPADQGSSNGCQGALNQTTHASNGSWAHDARTLLTLRERTNAPTSIPRYARVNVARATRDQVRQQLLDDPAFKAMQFDDDELLPDGLVFPAGTDLHAHALVKSGVLILQDRAR